MVTRHGDPVPNGCAKSDCSLREAIRAANAHAGPDKIVLPSTGIYKLAQLSTGEDGAKDGDLDITNDPLRIVHPAPGLATVDADGVDRVFEIFTVRRPISFGCVSWAATSPRVRFRTGAGSGRTQTSGSTTASSRTTTPATSAA